MSTLTDQLIRATRLTIALVLFVGGPLAAASALESTSPLIVAGFILYATTTLAKAVRYADGT